jgi:hypothetical protein
MKITNYKLPIRQAQGLRQVTNVGSPKKGLGFNIGNSDLNCKLGIVNHNSSGAL